MPLCLQAELTPGGFCCESGIIDGCGVCDGVDACMSRVDTTLDLAAMRLLYPADLDDWLVERVHAALCAAVGRRYACDTITYALLSASGATRRLTADTGTVTFDLAPMADDVYARIVHLGGEPAASNAQVTLALSALQANPSVALAATENLGKVPVCGDGDCALDEVTTCVADCPFGTGACPVPSTLDAGDPTVVRS